MPFVLSARALSFPLGAALWGLWSANKWAETEQNRKRARDSSIRVAAINVRPLGKSTRALCPLAAGVKFIALFSPLFHLALRRRSN